MVGLGVLAVALSTLILLCYLGFIWWLDRYEREPLRWVVLTFLWGALGATCLGVLLSVVMEFSLSMVIPTAYEGLTSAVIVAPLAEEFTKGLIFLILIFSKELDNETDGLIYGAAVGIGFAMVENLLYYGAVALTGTPEMFFFTVFARTFFSALVHTVSSALLGYTIGYVRHRRLFPWLWLWPVIGFVLAVVNHALWNLAATLSGSGLLDGTREDLEVMGIGMLLVVAMSVMMFAITQFSLMREQKIIKRYLREEAKAGVIPEHHVDIIPYWLKRRKKDWLPPQVNHQEYLRVATLLAFRRYQAETSSPAASREYEERVKEYRAQVRQLLGQEVRDSPWGP